MKKFLKNLSHKKNLLMRKIKKQDKNQIVLISDVFQPRVVKIAYALRKKNYRVILLCQNSPHNEGAKKLTNYFDKFEFYNTPQKALQLAIKYKPLVYHIFSCYTYDTPEFFIKSNIGKIIFDNYDGLRGFLKPELINKRTWIWGQEAKEQFCLENADGLCCRSLETQYQKRKFGYKYKGKRILFLDYCWNDLDIPDKPKNDEELHIAYAGGFVLEKEDPDNPWAYMLWLAQTLARQKIHFHLYPRDNFKKNPERFSDYIELDKNEPYFHFYEPIPNNLFAKELSKYDYGILIQSKDIEGRLDGDMELAKFYYCTSNKIFDYFNAGLPVIIHKNGFQSFITSRYGSGIPITPDILNNFNDYINNQSIKKENLKKTINKYLITNHIHRLIDFYNDI